MEYSTGIQSGNIVQKDCWNEKNTGVWVIVTQNIGDGERIQVAIKDVNADYLIIAIAGTEKMYNVVDDDSVCIAVKEADTDGIEYWIILSLNEFGTHRCSLQAKNLNKNTHIKPIITATSLKKLNMKASLPNNDEHESKKFSTYEAMSLISFTPPRAKLLGCENIGIAARCLNSLHSIIVGPGIQKSLGITPKDMTPTDGNDENQLLRWISLDNTTKKTKAIPLNRKCKEIAGKRLDGKIRVEIKLDNYGLGGKKQLILHELDSIKIKLTTFSLQVVPQKMEMDFVKSFTCELETDRCRRQVTKVLKRDIITDFNWEKGLTAHGLRFSIHWNYFQIPILTTADGEFNTFKVSNMEYEIRIRFFTDTNVGKAGCSACCFPVSVVRIM